MSPPKSLLCAFSGFCAAFGVLALTQGHPAQAQNPVPNPSAGMQALAARLNADEVEIAALQADNTALKAKTAPLSVSGTDLTITSVNVHLVSGSGSTNDGTADAFGNPVAGKSLSGLGNLIIGYNTSRSSFEGTDTRTGSHNLILGDFNNYSSFGGLVVGNTNAVSGPYASVSGGEANKASNYFASVSGGYLNTSSGSATSISGGYNLTQNSSNGWSGGSYHTP